FPAAPYVRSLPTTRGLRITFLMYGLESSGGVLSIAQLAREFLFAGHDVRMVSAITSEQMLWPERINLPCQPLLYSSTRRLLRDFPDSDVVIATYYVTAYDYLPYLREHYGYPSVYYLQDYEAWFFPDGDPRREQFVATLGMADACVIKSDWLADLLAAHGHASVKIHQGIDLDIFYPR